MDAGQTIERYLLNNRGALYEGDVFSALRTSPYVVRGFEFALADGAVDCSGKFDPEQSWGDRFWDTRARFHGPLDDDDGGSGIADLLLFEVKSSNAEDTERQVFISSDGQLNRVAFHICLVASDLSLVQVIPNMNQIGKALDEPLASADREEHSINVSRISRMPSITFGGIDQSAAPYIMPIRLLPLAISRIRACVRGNVAYENPWTKVSFPSWEPTTTRRMCWLEPATGTSQRSAYNSVMDIYQVISQRPEAMLKPDFMSLQPRLADFKLVLNDERQVLIQHKADNTIRARGARLDNVLVARNEGAKRHWHFAASDRFDFMWHQFIFSCHPSAKTQVEFFLLPERVIPDSFYTLLEKQVSFERDDFRRYRVVMDRAGVWVDRVQKIVEDNPDPRKAGERPLRGLLREDEVVGSTDPQGAGREVQLREADASRADDAVHQGVGSPVETGESSTTGATARGRTEYREVVIRCHRRFYYAVMRECALRSSGVLVVMATNHPICDFAYCQYRWSQAEREHFLATARPPIFFHQLPPEAEAIPIYVFSQFAACSYQGPNVRPRQYRRLDASALGRLVVWDLGGYDTIQGRPLPPAVIPSEDFAPAESQRQIFEDYLKVGGSNDTNISLSSLLNSGLYAAEYAVSQPGPTCYDNDENVWVSLWGLLDRLMSFSLVDQPAGHQRHAAKYRHPLRLLNQALVELHIAHGARDDPFLEE